MEVAMELEDDLFFADLTKQISLLIMDDDDQDPISTCPSVSLQAFSCEIHPPAQVPAYMYEQSCKRETKGTGVFIPQSTVPRRKQNRQGKYTNAYNNTKPHSRSQADQRNRKMVSQLPSDFAFRARNGRE
ncbi:uncharacterized protein LOC126791562 [Argentina anserina]|uniref:uncharacterized protein LOC126791562 n=1 Tax=Argentina anserina TaxID=57926 RepID=UPI00217644F3|nr:uncharacterized protein LOC126791562 [Potentilla anserina]